MTSPLVATPLEVADALQCSIDVVRDLKRSGRLPYIQLTKAMWAVPWAALNEWLATEAHASMIHAELQADGVAIYEKGAA